MAKGRKLTLSHSERYLGSYSYSHSQVSVTDQSELGEEDVWSVVDDSINGSHGQWSPRATTESEVSFGRGARKDRHVAVGGLSLAFDDSAKKASSRIVHQFASPRARHHVATSAPMDVPDWTKIYRVDSVDSFPDSYDVVDDSDADVVPPHEYLAREYARSRNSAAHSVFEGVGRTLKGRDMSRVRDAVWSQTGFDG